MSTLICQHPDCENKLVKDQKKYCSKSCATKINNQGNRRHGKPKAKCIICGNDCCDYKRKYCSNKCQGIASRTSDDDKRARNAEKQARYRMKGYRNFAPDADRNIMKEFYKNCPEGYEVDHIIPLSKGGLHHQNNLQYLIMKDNRSKGNRI